MPGGAEAVLEAFRGLFAVICYTWLRPPCNLAAIYYTWRRPPFNLDAIYYTSLGGAQPSVINSIQVKGGVEPSVVNSAQVASAKF